MDDEPPERPTEAPPPQERPTAEPDAPAEPTPVRRPHARDWGFLAVAHYRWITAP
jgi:hypothetical protein